MVAPPASDEQAEREEVPGRDRPSPRECDPRVTQTTGDERGHGEGERHGEPGEAEVERDRVRDHPRVFEQRVEAAAVGGDRIEARERRRRHGHDRDEEGHDGEHHGQRPRIELTRPLAMAEDHDQRVERQHPAPQDDRALQRSPHARDAIPERRAQVGIVRDVADGEIEGEERVDEEREAARDQREDAQRGVLRGLDEGRPARATTRGRKDGAGQREAQCHEQHALAKLGDHLVAFWSVLISSL